MFSTRYHTSRVVRREAYRITAIDGLCLAVDGRRSTVSFIALKQL